MMGLPYVDVACVPRKHTAITNYIEKVIQTTFMNNNHINI